MEEKLENIVRGNVVRMYGRKVVSSRDCIQLADEIYQKTNLQLNSNTLRRFFGLIKTDYPPSQTTLNILSKYCGFNSADEVYAADVIVYNEQAISFNKDVFVHYLVSLFRDIKLRGQNDETFDSLIKHTINFLNNNPMLSEDFQSQIAKTENGQRIYFEKFVNLDKLSSYYGRGLRYYAIENQTPQARIFANSLFVLRDWLTENNTKLERHYDKVTLEEIGNLDPIVHGRYFAAALYYHDANNLPADKPLAELNDFYTMLQTSKKYTDIFPYFNQVVSMALVLTGHYERAIYYLSNLSDNKPEYDRYSCLYHFQEQKLLQAFAYHQTGGINESERLFNEIKPQDFCFLNKSFCNIFYVYLSKALKRKNGKEDDQLMALIQETGFTRLKSILVKEVMNKTEH